MYSGSRVRETKNHLIFGFFTIKIITFNTLVLYHSRQFAMSHGSYDLNLGSEILILAGDIRSRSWPNMGGTYGMSKPLLNSNMGSI
jgi:hypothetical protein